MADIDLARELNMINKTTEIEKPWEPGQENRGSWTTN